MSDMIGSQMGQRKVQELFGLNIDLSENYLTVALILRNIISHPSDSRLFGIVCSNEKKTIISNDIEPKQHSINRSHFIQFIPLILR